MAIWFQWISHRKNEGHSRSHCWQWLWPGFSAGNHIMYNDFDLSFFHGIRYLWIIRLNYVLGDFWTRRSNEHGREDETRLSPFLRCLRNVRFQSDVLNYIDIKHAKMYLYIPCWLSYYQLIEVWSNFRRVGGSGTMILSKWEILETDTYSFTLHGHLHQVIYYFHSFAINWNSTFILWYGNATDQ